MRRTLPIALLDSLQRLKGFDREAFETVHATEEQIVSVRLNPDKAFASHCSMLKFQTRVPWCPYGQYLSERPSFTFDPLLHAGAYYVQEPSSMFLWDVLEQTVGKNTSGLRVLDLCGAPGGKSTLLASYCKDALVVSNEVIKSRAAILVENITKWGAGNAVVTNNDPKDFSTLQNYFDVIVVDAPCSGSGLFRKDTEAIEEWSEENVLLCSQRQQRILADAFPALKKNGILIYSTCSYSEEEDEDIADWLMDRFALDSCSLRIDNHWAVVEAQSEKHKAYGYRFFPDKLKGEGFFIAAFQKKEGDERDHRYPQAAVASKQEVNIASRWIREDIDLFFMKQHDNIICFAPVWKQDIALLHRHLYVKKAGITLGAVKGTDFIPDHAFAMSSLVNENIPRVILDYDRAIQYLKKKETTFDHAEKGWNIVKYCDANLGWVKVLHNRVNNYYPTNWRILKD